MIRIRAPAGAPRRALTVTLTCLLLAWLCSPLVWFQVSLNVAPESGTDPTPAEVRTVGWVDLVWWTVAVALPLVVFVVAMLTRRRVLTFVGGAAFVVPNLILILRGHPIWELLAAALDMIVTGVDPSAGV